MIDAPQSLEAIAEQLDAMASSIGFSGNSVLACNLRDKATAIRSHAQKQSEAFKNGMLRAAELVRSQPAHSDFPCDPRTADCLSTKITNYALRSESKGGQG